MITKLWTKGICESAKMMVERPKLFKIIEAGISIAFCASFAGVLITTAGAWSSIGLQAGLEHAKKEKEESKIEENS